MKINTQPIRDLAEGSEIWIDDAWNVLLRVNHMGEGGSDGGGPLTALVWLPPGTDRSATDVFGTNDNLLVKS